MKRLYCIIEDALTSGRIGDLEGKPIIAKRIKNIIQKRCPEMEGVDDRKNIHVLIYDSSTRSSFCDWIGGCFQKIQGKRLVYSSVHHHLATSGKAVIVLVAV